MKKKQIIECIEKEQLEIAIQKSQSTREVLAYFGISPRTDYYTRIRSRCEELGLNLPVYYRVAGANRYSLEELLKDGTLINNTAIKKRLLKEKIWENYCFICGLGPVWNGIELVLQVDHINGKTTDNRIENLRLTCPNCHTQTETFCNKNRSSSHSPLLKINDLSQEERQLLSKKSESSKICSCGNNKDRRSNQCSNCYVPKKRILWPEKTELLDMIAKSNFYQVGKTLGVSDNAIRKHLRAL